MEMLGIFWVGPLKCGTCHNYRTLNSSVEFCNEKCDGFSMFQSLSHNRWYTWFSHPVFVKFDMLLHSEVNQASSIGVPAYPCYSQTEPCWGITFPCYWNSKLPSIWSIIFTAGRDQDGSKARDPLLFGHEPLRLEMERNAKWEPDEIARKRSMGWISQYSICF